MNKNPLEAILNLFNRFSLQQKILIAGSVAATLVLLGILLFFLNEPNFSPLYSNLAEDDASKVIDYLNSQKIAYQINNNGQTIEVPKEKVYETRMALAGKGIPASGIVGYEIFDKNTMGMSEFMQKLNYKRALEGELARTIMEEDGVLGARVQIVVPQRSIFKDDEKTPTASVVLKLKNNFMITKGNVAAIVNLVSSSVEGLKPNNVTLIDTKGRILSKEFEENPIAYSSSKQYEIKQNVENYLAQKAQSILDNILGPGNAVIQVNADINFDQIEKTMELYDPESQVAISEQTIKTENLGKNSGDSSSQVSQNNTTNYEINKTVQKVVQGSGNIKRLSVAAVINDVAKEVKKGDNVETVFEPRSTEQMKKLEDIIKNAIGVTTERQDQFSIENISFETKPFDDLEVEKPSSIINNFDGYFNIILIVISMGGAMFILKSLMTKLKNQKLDFGNIEQLEEKRLEGFQTQTPIETKKQNKRISQKPKRDLLPIGDIEDDISDEAVRKQRQQEKISNYVAKNPNDTAKLIHSWIHEDEV
jgi:flagellar M-ring protein FliF